MKLLWRHNERDSVSNHQRLYCLLKRLFRCRSKITSKLRATGLCAWNSPGTGEFHAQKASNVENVSIWWRHHEIALMWLPKYLTDDWGNNSPGNVLVLSGNKLLPETMLTEFCDIIWLHYAKTSSHVVTPSDTVLNDFSSVSFSIVLPRFCQVI